MPENNLKNELNTNDTKPARYQGIFTQHEFSCPPIDEIWQQRRKREQKEGTRIRRFPVDDVPLEERGRVYLLANRRGKIKLV